MSGDTFNHREFIGRADEISAFAELVYGEGDARILSLRGGGGMGKSHLLKMFAHHCRTHKPPARVSLITLQEIGDGGPQALLLRIRESLAYQLDFPALTAVERSMQRRRDKGYAPPKAQIYAFGDRNERKAVAATARSPSRGADSALLAHVRTNLIDSFSLGELRELASDLGIQFDALEGPADTRSKALALVEYMDRRGRTEQLVTAAEHARPHVVWRLEPALDEDQETGDFQQRYIDSFFEDLRRHTDAEPVVLILDAYEQCDAHLQRWLIEYVCERFCFRVDRRPKRLVLVFAGREVPDFEALRPADEVEQTVRRIDPLGPWRAEDIEQCLSQYAPGYTPQYASALYTLHSGGVPVLDIVRMAQTLGASHRGQT
jgi:hypothetical protein